MSKPVKELMIESYKQRFGDVTGAVLIDIRGIDAGVNNRLRAGLHAKQVKVTVVKNSLAKKAFEGTPLEPVQDLLEGSAAMVYPHNGDATAVDVARELLTWVKQIEGLTFRGAVLDGTVFGPDEIETLSKYPTREEAQAQVVQLILTPAQKLVGSILSPAQKLAGLVDAIKDKLEAGEAIGKVA
ncbi:MAG: 50S ribosomal protein L10 [Phycisphaeraceae bacterium]